MIARNRHRTDKTLWTENAEGAAIQLFEAYDEREEAEYVVQRDAAPGWRSGQGGAWRLAPSCFAPTPSRARWKMPLCGTACPTQLVGAMRFYQRREIKDVLCLSAADLQPGRRHRQPAAHHQRAHARHRRQDHRATGAPGPLARGSRWARRCCGWPSCTRAAALGGHALWRSAPCKPARVRATARAGWLRSAELASLSELLQAVLEDSGYCDSCGTAPMRARNASPTCASCSPAVERYSALPARDGAADLSGGRRAGVGRGRTRRRRGCRDAADAARRQGARVRRRCSWWAWRRASARTAARWTIPSRWRRSAGSAMWA